MKILEEEIKLERNADVQRSIVIKRWDFNDEAIYKCLAGAKVTMRIDHKKLKQFFLRLKQPISDEEIFHLIKRVIYGYLNFIKCSTDQQQWLGNIRIIQESFNEILGKSYFGTKFLDAKH